jgi:hypothetical protein
VLLKFLKVDTLQGHLHVVNKYHDFKFDVSIFSVDNLKLEWRKMTDNYLLPGRCCHASLQSFSVQLLCSVGR